LLAKYPTVLAESKDTAVPAPPPEVGAVNEPENPVATGPSTEPSLPPGIGSGVCHADEMVDRQFADSELAELYDLFHPWEQRGDFEFYLPLVMSAEAVLDVGCGTGALLHAARQGGHTGRLCGIDPAMGMLAQARTRSDIEWVLGDLASVAWEGEFDLVVMTGHAFQVLVDDADLHASLGTIREALTNDGRFIFETRNPLVRAWEGWTRDGVAEVTTTAGVVVRMRHEVEIPVKSDIVRFTTTFDSPDWTGPRVSLSTLRFLDADALSSFLSDAGLVIEEQFGDWNRRPLSDTSPEIITTARLR
jgi:SAM-dependent methyltransferase